MTRYLETVVAVVVAVAVSPVAVFAQQPKAGTVTTLEGLVTATRSAVSRPVGLRFKDDVFLRDRITTGDRSLARMLLGGTAVVTVRERSTLVISEVPGRSTIELQSGKIALAVARDRMRPGEQIDVRTPNAVAAVRGTVVVAEVTRATAQVGPAAPAITTTFYVLRGTVLTTVLDPVTGAPAGPPQTLNVLQSFSVSGTSAPRIAPISQDQVSGITAGLQPSAVPPTAPGNAAQLRQQALLTTGALLTALVGGAPTPLPPPPVQSVTTQVSERPRIEPCDPVSGCAQTTTALQPAPSPGDTPPPGATPPADPTPPPMDPTPPPAEPPEISISGESRALAGGETLKTFSGASTRTLTSPDVLVTNGAFVGKSAVDGVIQIAPGAVASLASPLLTVNGASTIDTVNADMHSTLATVPLTDFARDVAVTPSGARAYLVGSGPMGTGFVDIVDTATNTVVGSIDLGQGAIPSAVAITPDGSRAYVADSSAGMVSVVSTATNTVTTALSGFSGAAAVAITPDGSQAYVVVDGAVNVIDTATNTFTAIQLNGARRIALTPDGTRAYVTIDDGESAPEIAVIDTATNTVTAGRIGSGVFSTIGAIVASRDGTRAYVADGGTIRVVNTLNNTTGGSFPLSVVDSVGGLALTPDGSRLYVTLRPVNRLVILNTATEVPSLIATVDLSAAGVLSGLTVTPNGGRLYITVDDSGALTTRAVSALIVIDASPGASLVTASGGGRLVSTSTAPLVQFDGATVDVGAEVVSLAGRANAVATEVADGVSLTLGTDEPIRTAGALIQATNAAVSARRALLLDTALLAASAPILDLSSSTLTTSIDAIDLLQRAKLTSVGPLARLDASTLTVNSGGVIRVTGGSLLRVTGDLLELNNGAIMNILNGPVLRVSGASVVNVTGAFVNFGGTGNNQINVTNTLCATACSTVGGIPFVFLGGASPSQVSVGPNAIRNPALGTIVRSNANTTAVIAVDGPTSRVTIAAP